MKESRVNLFHVEQTGAEMARMIREHWRDMADMAGSSAEDVFRYLQAIPYRRDPPGEEYLQRPLAFRLGAGRGADCDDRAICVGCWAVAAGYPWRIVGVSRRPDLRLHHVFTEVYFSPQWVPVDPTYSTSGFGRSEAWTRREILAEGRP